MPAAHLVLNTAPNLETLTVEERERVSVRAIGDGRVVFEVNGTLDEEFALKLEQVVAPNDREPLRRTLAVYQRQNQTSPAQRGERFVVPQLCLWVDGQLEIAEKEWFLEPDGWNLLNFPAELLPGEFDIQERAESFLIDIYGRQLTTRYLGANLPLDINTVETGWTDLSLVRWLDGMLYQPDIHQNIMLEWLRQCVKFLMERRGMKLVTLVRARFILEKALREKIKNCRLEAYNKGYQLAVFNDSGARVETSFEYAFVFAPDNYLPNWAYNGRYQFSKHYFSRVGELGSSGEEFECAQVLDRCPEVKYWVRNLAQSTRFSFRLPLANGHFYPDFVCQLNDGRILVVEYKGAHLEEYEKEKRNVGELWQEKSGGKALFLWATKEDERRRNVAQQLQAKLKE